MQQNEFEVIFVKKLKLYKTYIPNKSTFRIIFIIKKFIIVEMITTN